MKLTNTLSMMKKLLLLAIVLTSLNIISQSSFESWNTLNVKGKINPRLTLAIEGEQRYNFTYNYIRYFHTDLGLVHEINDQLSIGSYYRELYEVKNGSRVIEIRPHLDFFYKFNDKWNVRIRNEYQIKELDSNIYRFRIRPTYKYKINKAFSLFIQTEGFFVSTSLVRNRFNPGIAIVLDKIIIEPGYMLESNNKESWNHIHIFWINTKIKF